MSLTSKRAAAIRRAEKAAQAKTTKLDADSLKELEGIYKEASVSIREQILNAADPNGVLIIEVLRPLLSQIEQLMQEVGFKRDQLLNSALAQAIDNGVGVMSVERAVMSAGLVNAAQESLEFATTFIDEGGLQLSDRLWRLNQGAVKSVGDVIKQGIIQGMDSTQATDALLSANAGKISKDAASAFMADNGPRWQAMRVVRTEINRAHNDAFELAGFEHPDVVGTRFNLSSNHPRKDICDMHASVNRYGLGKGVYPKGRNPYPAHPNTMSFKTLVFRDDVTDADRAGKEDRIAWLGKQSNTTRDAVLGKGKAAVFADGKLSERMITSTLKAVQKRAGITAKVITTAVKKTSKKVKDTAFRVAKDIKEAIAFAGDNLARTIAVTRTTKLDGLNIINKNVFKINQRFKMPKINFIGDPAKSSARYSWNSRISAAYGPRADDFLFKTKASDIKKLKDDALKSNAHTVSNSSHIPARLDRMLEQDAIDKRVPKLYAKRFKDGWIWSNVDDPKTLVQHELGHRLHNLNKSLLDPIIREGYRDGWGYLTSKYGNSKLVEYMAETMVLYLNGKHKYIYPPLLKALKSLDTKATK